jgi:hypothetical protein
MANTLTTLAPFRRGDVIGIGAGTDCEFVKVRRCTGSGPYTVAIRRYRWFDRLLDRIRARWRRMLKPISDWRYDRCDVRWCPRKAVALTADYDEFCMRHAPADGVHGLENDA